ncbi:MAG TPA: ORF6N domain-containing protein [Bryobacteraceae bacterium]|nr:ORF6N domain-containing protein [Bryobacteraceae bacterium]
MPKKKSTSQELVPVEIIERRILLIRGHKVMLDSHLAELYQVPTFRLNEAVKRNRKRFPADFMFQLTKEEAESLKLQFGISNSRSQIAISKPGRGGRRYLPYVFTEQGVAMLSTVLNSDRAIAVNIAVMRTFVRLRQILGTHKELAERLAEMEKKYDQRFKVVFDILKQLMEPPPEPPKRPFGFMPGKGK